MLLRQGVSVVAYAPDAPDAVRAYAEAHATPFPIAASAALALRTLGQRASWLPFSRMPGLIALGEGGSIRHVHVGRSPRDLPDLAAVVRALRA